MLMFAPTAILPHLHGVVPLEILSATLYEKETNWSLAAELISLTFSL